MSWKEYYVYNFENTALDAGTGIAFTDTVVRFDSDADFEAMKFHHIATDSRVYVRMADDAYGRQFQNTRIDLRALSGTILFTTGVVDVGISPNNFLGSLIGTPMLVRAATTYTMQFSDFSNVANSIRLSMHGAKLRNGEAPWKKNWKAKVPFYYSGQATVGASSSASINISINIDSHFLVQRITGVRDGAATINIIDGATDRAWMDRPMHIDNLVGNSQFPNVLVAPRFVQRGAVINVQLQDLSAAENDIEVVLHGVKLF